MVYVTLYLHLHQAKWLSSINWYNVSGLAATKEQFCYKILRSLSLNITLTRDQSEFEDFFYLTVSKTCTIFVIPQVANVLGNSAITIILTKMAISIKLFEYTWSCWNWETALL